MILTFVQKFKLYFVLLIIFILAAVDRVSVYIETFTGNFIRLGLYVFIVFVILTGVAVESNNGSFFRIIGIFDQNSTDTLVLGASTVNSHPRLVNKLPLPEIHSRSVFSADPISKKVYLDINGNLRLPPASTTKLMTALVSLDIYALDELLLVPVECTKVEGQKIGFVQGEILSVKDLLYGMLVASGADAACTLSVSKVSYNDFVDLMNKKVSLLGLKDTHFTNPIGLDSYSGENYSTAGDLYKIALKAREYKFLKETFMVKEIKLSSSFPRILRNTNDLLWNLPGSVGIKTGRTYEAGEVLIYEYDDGKGRNIISVVMRSSDRFSDTKRIVEWILKSYSWPERSL